MEEKGQEAHANDTTTTTIVDTTTERKQQDERIGAPTGKKAKRGAPRLSLLRAVFFTLIHRHHSSNKKAKRATNEQINVVSAGHAAAATGDQAIWKNIVGGVRPLHLHQLQYCSLSDHHAPPPPPPPPPAAVFGHEVYHDVLLAPPSPAASSDHGITSCYASAEDLQKLDKISQSDDGEKEAGIEEENGCPNAIDMQAEEFIAKFYEQMRLQRLESLDRGD